MNPQKVKFLYKDMPYYTFFKTENLKLWKVFYIKINQQTQEIKVQETWFEWGIKVAISWIAPSDRSIFLIDECFNTDDQENIIKKVHSSLQEYIEYDEIYKSMKNIFWKLKIDHFYKSSEYDRSCLRTVLAVYDRLQLVDKIEEIHEHFREHADPLISYHLLTCFDLLGQPNWGHKEFDQWLLLESWEWKPEGLLYVQEDVLNLYKHYKDTYSVKKSFFRFINELLPQDIKYQLYNSINIYTNSMPPNIRNISEDWSEDEKSNFLFSLRNDYTHNCKTMPGILHTSVQGIGIDYDSFIVKRQVLKENERISYMVKDWPNILKRVVKMWLTEYIAKNGWK